jgi:O-antigen/teichoic acid export membrane protein
MNRFIRDSASVLGTQIGVTIISVGTSVITARMLGPHDRGLFQLLVLLPTTLSNFVKFGVPQANVYFMRRRNASASDVASNSVWFALVLGGGLAIIAYLFRDRMLSSFLREAPPATIPASLVLVPCVLLQTFFSGVLQAEHRFGEFNFQQIMPALLGLLGMPIALVWLRTGLVGAIVTQTIIAILVTIWLAARVNRTAKLRFGWNPGLARGMLTFGGKSYLQTLASTLHFRIDQYMIAMLLDPTQVGLYAVAVNLTNLLLKIPDASGTVLYPRLAAAGEHDAHKQTSAVCRHTLFVMVVSGLCYAIGGPFAIRFLYGQAYVGAIRPLLLMLPGIIMISLYLLLTRNFTSRNRQQVNIVAAVAALAINVGLNCILIPRWGISGAAISTAVSYSIAALILLVVFVRESGYTVAETILVQRKDLGGYMRLMRPETLSRGGAAARMGLGENSGRHATAGKAGAADFPEP